MTIFFIAETAKLAGKKLFFLWSQRPLR